MVSSSYSRAEEIRQGTNNSDLRKIFDQQLVRLCLENNRRILPPFHPYLRGKIGYIHNRYFDVGK
jgi:hypothetical protein